MPSISKLRPIGGCYILSYKRLPGIWERSRNLTESGHSIVQALRPRLWEGCPRWLGVGLNGHSASSHSMLWRLPLCIDVPMLPFWNCIQRKRSWLPVQSCAWVNFGEGCLNFERPLESRLSKSVSILDQWVVKGSFRPLHLNMCSPASLVWGHVVSQSTGQAPEWGRPEPKSELCPILVVTFSKVLTLSKLSFLQFKMGLVAVLWQVPVVGQATGPQSSLISARWVDISMHIPSPRAVDSLCSGAFQLFLEGCSAPCRYKPELTCSGSRSLWINTQLPLRRWDSCQVCSTMSSLVLSKSRLYIAIEKRSLVEHPYMSFMPRGKSTQM